MKPTIKDIARETGYSVSTVSLALRSTSPNLAPETVARICNVAKRIGYRPNQRAASLVTRRTMTLGLILPDIANPFFALLARGAGLEAQAQRYGLFLMDANDEPTEDIRSLQTLMDRGVDGIVLVYSANSEGSRVREGIELCASESVPLVLADRWVDEGDCPSVYVDQELGGYLATRHLLDLGHRSIACMTGPMSTSTSQKRFYGYIRALQESDVPFNSALVFDGAYSYASGYERAAAMLDRPATAVFAFSDAIARGAYRRAVERGLRVPEDLSIVGYDDMPDAALLECPLTTVRQPSFEVGRRAIGKLIDQIEGREATSSDVLTPELIERASTHPHAETEETP